MRWNIYIYRFRKNKKETKTWLSIIIAARAYPRSGPGKSRAKSCSRVDTSVKNRPLSENSISAIPNSLEIVTFVCNFTLGLASEINLITDELTDDALVSFTTSSFIKGSLNGRL